MRPILAGFSGLLAGTVLGWVIKPTPAAAATVAPTPGPASPTVLPGSTRWVRVDEPTLTPGVLYRWSIPLPATTTTAQSVVDKLTASGKFTNISVWINQYPPDWPAEDRLPNRERVEAKPVVAVNRSATADPTLMLWRAAS